MSPYLTLSINQGAIPGQHEGDTAFNYRFSGTVNTSNVYYPGERLPVELSLVAGEIISLILDHFLKYELQSGTIGALNGTIEDTQMGAASLVSKVYLNNLQILQQGDPEILSKTLLTLLAKLVGFLKFKYLINRKDI